VWALRDINFEVNQGEILGIIGRNGAGKSTLLKILSRTTGPTIGSVKMKGRIASLLEVGTGFHGELSGRENIFLNGAIMGMHKAEIKSKLDEIIDFAGVEKYIDTPVKRYSSGMYVRLAFGVAAHLEPDIMIVDEVLAVGDAEFQKKALGKMKDVSTYDGRTVLFVSHNVQAIKSLCNRAILLDKGKVSFNGNVQESIAFYLNQKLTSTLNLSRIKNRIGDGKIRIGSVEFYNQKNEAIENLTMGCYCKIMIRLNINDEAVINKNGLEIAIAFKNSMDQQVIYLSSHVTGDSILIERGNSISCTIPKLILINGQYSINLFVSYKGVIADWITDVGPIYVDPYDYYGTGKIETSQGLVIIDYKWDIV